MERARIIDDPTSLVRATIYRQGDTRKKKVVITEFELFQLASLGCTQAEVAQFFCCDLDTLTKALRTDEDLRQAWDRGSANSKVSLRRLQIQHASRMDASGVQMVIHMSKHKLDEHDKVKNEVTGKNGEPLKVTFNFDSPAERAKNAGISD